MSNNFSFDNRDLKDKIFRFCLRILGDTEEAKDTVQDVYEKLWRLKEDFGKYKSVEALSLTMSKNFCLNRLKHNKLKEDKISAKYESEPLFSEQNYEVEELSEIVKQLIAILPQKQRLVIHLRDVEGMTFEEISETLEMEAVNVRMNLSRARKSIQEELIRIMNYGL
jgi:RNA polymerase sigma factor (sigma-70 family)